MDSYKAKTNIFTTWLYPLFIAVLVLVGNFTGLEVYTAVVNTLIVCLALWVSNTIKPFLFFMLTFAYQMPAEHLYPSDYYYTGYRPHLLIGTFAILLISLCGFIIKNKLFSRMRISKIPLLFPLIIMTVCMLLNGINRPDYNPMSLLWAALMMLVYFLIYVIIYLGIKGEDMDKMVHYFTYMTLLMSWILILQMGKLYFVDGVIVDGEIRRDLIKLGFGVQNLIGFHISTLIPVNIYGFMKGKTPVLSLITAFALAIANIATTSRNSMLIGTFYFVVCLILCMFFGDRKKAARIIIPVCILVCAGIFFVFQDKFMILVNLYLDRGMDSSGRIDIWKECFNIFKDNPLFGVGFFGLQVAPQFVPDTFIPEFAHNTIFELLGATGAVGFLGYGIYRIATLKYVFYKPTLDRFMILVGASVVVAEGLLDNYVFSIYTTFYYVTALAIAVRLYDRQLRPSRSEYDFSFHLN